ncbi:patatin-like phospholipase family protein [Kangiella sp. TOML190]|uniref:patatin-like phospholipase family protein n=1 Tax=Kangiella sp. TOML190 TaxID=2931351 RepID=UPI00203C598B|nr:patatin-like phospholipase family protein [Kangiella sp. TOML190]
MPKLSTGLVLSGGGARAAYQVGALQAINKILDQPQQSPFDILTGISAGAINSCVLATHNHQFSEGIGRLAQVWGQFQPNQVYRTDFAHLSRNLMHWLWGMAKPKQQTKEPMALLDNTPLKELLSKVLELDSIQNNIEQGNLTAVCTTAYDYNTGDSVSFYQGTEALDNWQRFRRRGQADKLTVEHLLASSAIPMVFPSTAIDGTHYGDGAMRFLTPLSPALHLGSRKLLVITVNPLNVEEQLHITTPSLGDISGHLLNSIFIDSLESDIERLIRVNQLLEHIPQEDTIKDKLSLKPIDALILSPSIDPAELAGRYFKELPRGLKFFFKRMGIADDKGESILSYLLFYAPFTKHLMQIGYEDTMAEATAVKEFFLE